MSRPADRAIFRRQGRCSWCGKRPLATTRHCARCQAQNRTYQRERYQRLREGGLCVQCGESPTGEGPARCAPCRAKMQAYWRKHMRKQQEDA